MHPGGCACASCAYGKKSKIPSRELMQGASDIDKLYYGKYLPLRERKLLEKLIRTRDFYDDVRDQLLSSSSSNRSSSEYKNEGRDDVTTKSSAVREMVNLVERGKNSCCTCCSCETLMKLKKEMKKRKLTQHPCVHGHLINCEDITRYCAEAAKRGRKRRGKLSKKISSKIGAARMKIKRNISEPTLSLTSRAVSQSKAFVKKIRSKKKIKERSPKVVTTKHRGHMARRKKVKSIRSSTTEASAGSESEYSNRRDFGIKKDSLILFKEKLLRKRPYEENKDVECEPGTCDEAVCNPEECLAKIKALGFRSKPRRFSTRHFGTGRDKSDISVGSRTKKRKVRESQVQIESTPHGNVICECKSTKTKSTASNTSLPKQKSVTATEMKTKRVRPPKRKTQGTLREHIKKKKTQKKERYPLEHTESSSAYSQTKLESKTKSSHSMTSTRKSQGMSPSKPELKEKRSMSPKLRQEKAYKTTGSMTSLSMKEAKAQSGRKEKRTASKTKKPKAKLQIKVKDKPLEETVQIQVPPKSNIICECPLASYKSIHKHRREPHGTITERNKKSKSHFTETSSRVSQQSYVRESKSNRGTDLPFPRECDPYMCIPFECDPEKCAQILLSRSKSRSRSTSSSTERTKYKSKNIQSKSAVNLKRKAKRISHEPPAQKVKKEKDAIISYPQKNAVKISSSFSFDIEFYKEKYPVEEVEEKQYFDSGRQTKLKQKKLRKKHKNHGPRISRHSMSSQSATSQSVINQVGHKLKRCFCTLKLLQKKKKIQKPVSKQTMASIHSKELSVLGKKQTQTRPSENDYKTSSVSSSQTVVCECSEIIRQRNRKTNTADSKKSKVACMCESVSISTSRKIQSSENRTIKHSQTQVQKQKQEHKREHKPKQKQRRRRSHPALAHTRPSRIKSVPSSQRQAVRIGSNFSFNVEFSKTKTSHQDVYDVSDKPTKKERRRLKQKGIKVHKQHVHHQGSEMNKHKKSKQTYTEPFLQRCLCTLKLLKKNKKKVEIRSPWRNRSEYVMHMQNNSITTNRAEIRYNHERLNLLPYECETGLSVSEEHYPNNRKKISQMKLQHNYSNISDPVSGSIFNKTLRTGTPSKSRNTQSFTRDTREKVKNRQDYYQPNIMPSRSKQQLMRVGSELSLNIDFSKKKKSPCKSSIDNFTTNEDLKNKHAYNKDKLMNHKSKEIEAKRKDKGSYLGSVIKKCFSALKFPKKRNKAELENKNNLINENMKYSSPLPNAPISESKLPYDLSSFKFAPSFWMPEICAPYECYEKSKQRQIKELHNRYVRQARHERKSVMSVPTSDYSINKKTKSTQSRLFKHQTKEVQKVRDKQKKLKAVRSYSPSRQTDRNGINSGFNKEITKNSFVPSIQDTSNNNRVEKYNTVRELSIKRIKDKDRCPPQTNIIRKEGKPSNVGFLLKRCFCTLGLQKKNIPKREFLWNQPITTQFVQVEQNKNIRNNVTKPECRNVLTKTLYGEEPLPLKLPEDGFLFRENLFGNENDVNNPYCYDPQNLKNSSSFSKRPHVRSGIDFSFDKIRYLLSTQKINPFYQSLYAMNVKICKSKAKTVKCRCPADTRASACGDCDPEKCYKTEYRRKHSRLSDRANMQRYRAGDSADVCYKRCREEFGKVKKEKKPTGPDHPKFLGSDVSVGMGVYKDTDPYKTRNHRAFRMGSDLHAKVDFFQASESRAIPNYIRKCFCKPKPPCSECPRFKKPEPIENESTKCKCKKELKKQAKKGPKAKICTCPVEPVEDETCKACLPEPTYKKPEPPCSKCTGNKKPELEIKLEKCECNKKSKKKAKKGPKAPKHCKCEKWLVKQDKKGPKAKICRCPKVEPKKKKPCKACLRKEGYRPCPHQPEPTKMYKKDSVSYGSNFNVDFEFFKHRGHNQKSTLSPEEACAKYSRIQEYGDGNIRKPKGSQSERVRVIEKLREKCVCCTPFKGGKKLSPKPSMQTIPIYDKSVNRKRCKTKREKNTMETTSNDEESVKRKRCKTKRVRPCPKMETQSEREFETAKTISKLNTIMPYSKRKFKEVDSQSRVVRNKTETADVPICPCCQKNKQVGYSVRQKSEQSRITKRSKKSKADQKPKKVKFSLSDRLKKSIKREKKSKKEIVEAVCPMCKAIAAELSPPEDECEDDETEQTVGASGKKGKVDRNPLFEMTLNKTNMKIVNKDEVLKNLGTSDKPTAIVKRAQRALRRGNADPPVVEMIVDKGNATIINQDKTIKQIDRARGGTIAEERALEKQKNKDRKALMKSHPKGCKCCICTKNKKKGKPPPHSLFSMKHHTLGPCVCGSLVCKKDVERMKEEQRSLANVKIRKCVCGGNICAEESSKMPEVLLEASRQAEREKVMAHRAKIKQIQYEKERKARAAQWAKKDKKLWGIRKREDQRALRAIRRAKTDGSVIMVAESLIDLGTFGSKAFCDIAKTLARSITHPRDSYNTIRETIAKPKLASKPFERFTKGMGLYSTLGRVQYRLLKMPIIKSILMKMESHPCTNYLAHIADKDPKKRMKKFKKTAPERVDFKCSLYMASLRKRPLLRIYQMCPWFYPHCVGLLQAWKQLMDILLFVLAVAVWSPCILCMEICRGFVCCCMCQG